MIELNGRDALLELIKGAGHESLNSLVAQNTLFTHPDTVRQTENRSLFRIIRRPSMRGSIIEWDDGNKVMCCDNEGPNRAFVWANRDFKYSEVQFNHIYSSSKNVNVFTSVANICITPAFIARLTDTNIEVMALLKYRAYDLYGFYLKEKPSRPEGYDKLKWMNFIPSVESLEETMLKRLIACRASRSGVSAREIGWLFSNYEPDQRLK